MSAEVSEISLMLEAERVFIKLRPSTLILRLGGLMGYDRVAGKYSAGKSFDYDVYVNYIHRDDVVNIIELMIEKNIQAECFNLVAPVHCARSDVYHHNAEDFGFEKSTFDSLELQGKKVSSSKLLARLGYQFIYENPLDFWKVNI